MGFYYDDLMNNDANTIELFLYKNDSAGTDSEAPRMTSVSKINNATDTVSVLKGMLNVDPTMTVEAQWGGASTFLSSLRTSLNNFVQNSVLTITRLKQTAMEGLTSYSNKLGARAYAQENYYNLNDYIKVFKGLGSNIPISMKVDMFPYIDSNNKYITVNEQLETFLNTMFSKSSVEVGEAATEGDKGFWKKLSDSIDPKTQTADATSTRTADNATTVLRFKAPHNYMGIPNSFTQDAWMSGTLALRANSRWIRNLLLNSIQVTVSKWSTQYNDKPGISYAQVYLTLIPAVMLTPYEQMQYLFAYTSSEETVKPLKKDKTPMDAGFKVDHTLDRLSRNTPEGAGGINSGSQQYRYTTDSTLPNNLRPVME